MKDSVNVTLFVFYISDLTRQEQLRYKQACLSVKKNHFGLCIRPLRITILFDSNLEHKGDEEEGKKYNSSTDKANVEVQLKIWLLFLRS